MNAWELPGRSAATAGAALEPLRCHGCGSSLAIPEGDVARCPYCHATAPVPAPYRALRAARFSSEEDRGTAEALYARLGSMPGPLLRAWGGASSGVVAAVGSALVGWLGVLGDLLEGRGGGGGSSGDPRGLLGVVLFVLALPAVVLTVLGIAVAAAWRGAAGLAHRPVPGPIGAIPMMLGLGAAFVALVLVPSVVLSRAIARGGLKRRVQGALAARAPEKPGGPACCRACGAPLDVAPGALGARCGYCASDNLVALEPAWVVRARAFADRTFRTIDGFLEEEQALQNAAHERIFGTVFRVLCVGPLVFCVGWALSAVRFTF